MKIFSMMCGIWLVFAAPARADLYLWTDAQGTIHVVDEKSSVPDEYKNQVKVYRETRSPIPVSSDDGKADAQQATEPMDSAHSVERTDAAPQEKEEVEPIQEERPDEGVTAEQPSPEVVEVFVPYYVPLGVGYFSDYRHEGRPHGRHFTDEKRHRTHDKSPDASASSHRGPQKSRSQQQISDPQYRIPTTLLSDSPVGYSKHLDPPRAYSVRR